MPKARGPIGDRAEARLPAIKAEKELRFAERLPLKLTIRVQRGQTFRPAELARCRAPRELLDYLCFPADCIASV